MTGHITTPWNTVASLAAWFLVGIGLSLTPGCDAKEDDVAAPSATAEAKPAWLSALEDKKFEYPTLAKGETIAVVEAGLMLEFGKATTSGEAANASASVPITMGYEGEAKSHIVTAVAFDRDSVETTLQITGDSTLPSPGAKRKFTVRFPLSTTPAKLVFDAGIGKVTLERKSEAWSVAPDDALTRRKEYDGGLKNIEALCNELATEKCVKSGSSQVDGSVSFQGSGWRMTYCPSTNCYDRCSKIREIYGNLGGEGKMWMRADPTYCVTGPDDRSKIPDDAGDKVGKVVKKPLISTDK